MLQDENGYIVLSMKHQSPSLAKEWIEIFVEEINSFTDRRINWSQKSCCLP